MKIPRTLVLLYENQIIFNTWTISLFKHFPGLPVNIMQSHFHEEHREIKIKTPPIPGGVFLKILNSVGDNESGFSSGDPVSPQCTVTHRHSCICTRIPYDKQQL